MFKKKKKNLKEAFTAGNLNLDYPDYEIKLTGVIPETNAKAINDRKETVEKINQDFKDKNEIQNEFVKEQDKKEITESMENIKPIVADTFTVSGIDWYDGRRLAVTVRYRKTTKDFAVADTNANNVFYDSRLRFLTREDAEAFVEAFKRYSNSKDSLKVSPSRGAREIVKINTPYSDVADCYVSTIYLDSVGLMKEEMDEAFENKNLKEVAEKISEDIDNFLDTVYEMGDGDKYLTDVDYNYLNRASEALQDFAIQYSDQMNEAIPAIAAAAITAAAAGAGSRLVDKVFGESAADEAEEPSEPVKKKRVRGKNDSAADKLWHDDDLYTRVYDDLSSEVEPNMGKEIKKEVQVKRGSRYMGPYPGPGDYDLSIWGKSPEDFESAKKIADHYGVKMDIKKDVNRFGRSKDYPYTAILRNLK